MTDRTAHKLYKTAPRASSGSYIIADGVVLGSGALVQLEGGYLNHWDETGVFLGLFLTGTDRANDGVITGETSDTPPVEGRVDESGTILMHVAVAGTVAQTDVGCLIYCADSDIAGLTKTDTTNPPIGWLKYFRSTSDCDVQLFTPGEWLAGNAGSAWAT